MEYVLDKNIKKEREQRGWSLQELSKMLKSRGISITAATLQRYESGEIKSVPYKSIIALADTFVMSPATLMGWGPSEIELADSVSVQYMKYYDALKTKLEQATLMELVKIFTRLPEKDREAVMTLARKKDSEERARKAADLQAKMKALQEELDALVLDDNYDE